MRDFHGVNVIKSVLEDTPAYHTRSEESLAYLDDINEVLVALLWNDGYQHVCPVCDQMRDTSFHQSQCPLGRIEGSIPSEPNWLFGMRKRRGRPIVPVSRVK